MAITFKELKAYISRIIPVSICFRDGHYDNYTLISDVPTGRYDDLYVYGIGTIDVEFAKDVYIRPSVNMPEENSLKEFYFGCGLEIVLQEKPRDIQRQDERLLYFSDVRGYLQSGINFSVVMREDWSSEQYTWKRDIPEQYNSFYVYGIGLEDVFQADIPEEFKHIDYERIRDTRDAKRMVLVLSKTPRTDVIKEGRGNDEM